MVWPRELCPLPARRPTTPTRAHTELTVLEALRRERGGDVAVSVDRNGTSTCHTTCGMHSFAETDYLPRYLNKSPKGHKKTAKYHMNIEEHCWSPPQSRKQTVTITPASVCMCVRLLACVACVKLSPITHASQEPCGAYRKATRRNAEHNEPCCRVIPCH